MGYRLNRLDEPVFMAVPKPMLTEFGIHYRLEIFCSVYPYKPNCVKSDTHPLALKQEVQGGKYKQQKCRSNSFAMTYLLVI